MEGLRRSGAPRSLPARLLLGPLPTPLPSPALIPGLAASLHHSQLGKGGGAPPKHSLHSGSGNSLEPVGAWESLNPLGLSFSREDGPGAKRSP